MNTQIHCTFVSSILFIPLFQHPLTFSGQGQWYSWSSTWWLLSPSCWSYWRAKKFIFILVIKTLKNPLENGKKLPQREHFVEGNRFCKSFYTKFFKTFSKVSMKHFSKHFHKKFQINSGDGIQDTTQEYKRSTVAHINLFFSNHHQSNIWSVLLSSTPILYPSAF